MPGTATTLAFALSVLSIFAKAKADSHNECIPITKTSACAPFGEGHYINGTELGLVYGLSGPIPDAQYWDKLVRDVTSGGEHQAQMWKNWAQCAGYSGEPIQYYRTYACITDIFLFSKGCNKEYKPPVKPICTQSCDAYGAALRTLITDERICPLSIGDYGQDVYREVSKRRSYALTGADSCKKVLGEFKSQDSGSCMWGVEEDSYSCGFAGDSETAEYYCKDYPNAECCKHRKEGHAQQQPSQEKPKVDQQTSAKTPALIDNSAATSAQAANGDIGLNQPGTVAAESWMEQNKTPVIAGSVGVAAVLIAVGAAVGVMRARRRRSVGRNNRIQPGSGVPFIAPAMTQATGDATNITPLKAKYKVVFDYTPQLIDELELVKGDMVEVWASYDDGWGKGCNLRTGNKGTFPMACIEQLRD